MARAAYTLEEVKKHNTAGDLWLVVAGGVYDVSKFSKLHPGGRKVLEEIAGTDATDIFFELHQKNVLQKYSKLLVGTVGAASSLPSRAAVSPMPFDDLPMCQGVNSPYYNESHHRLQKAVRKFVAEEVMPLAQDEDFAGDFPDKDIKKTSAMAGMSAGRCGPGPWLKECAAMGIKIPGDVKPEEFDYFHELIMHQEYTRLGTPGWVDGVGGGLLISLPAILNFGSDEMKRTVGKEILLGNKQSCLAISEPYAGSDVANVRATAKLTPDGKHYIVNGVKKWITEGMTADYFVTAVRTGGKGAKGLSLLLVERSEGVSTKLIKTTYSTSAGTALVLMEDVMVPVTNLLGKENDGFRLIMYNFNHERWMIANNIIGFARAALADSFMWANQRKVFGQPLMNQPVIRDKLANSGAALNAVWALLEQVTYDMTKSKGGPMSDRMGGQIAMLKLQATKVAWKVADDAVQIMGGRGITKTGMGTRVENFKNYSKYAAVYGGSEEIMASLSIKMLLKDLPNDMTAKL